MATYAIPEANVDELTNRLARLAARAQHCGCEPITWRTVGEDFRPHPRKRNVTVRYELIEVYGDTPRVKDAQGQTYQFLAAIVHGYDADNEERINLVLHARDVEGELPAAWRTIEPHCDHCGTERPRRKTYMLVDGNGNVQQVGSACLGDFLRTTDPQAMASLFENLVDALHKAQAEDEWDSESGRGTGYINLHGYLTHVCTQVRVDGFFLTRKNAEGRLGHASVPTSDRALTNMQEDEHAEGHDMPTDEDKAKAQAVIDWAKAICDGEDVNDYLFNLSVLARMGYIQFRHTGLAASMVNAYERDKGILAERLAAKEGRKPSEHQGTVGEKGEVVVKVTRMVSVPGYAYNSTRELYLMADENGNVFTWTTQGMPLDEGATYRLVGKVKEHSEYHGTKQTRLTRCKVLETLEETDAQG